MNLAREAGQWYIDREFKLRLGYKDEEYAIFLASREEKAAGTHFEIMRRKCSNGHNSNSPDLIRL